MKYDRRPWAGDDGRYDCICGHSSMFHAWYILFSLWFGLRVLGKCEYCVCPKFRGKNKYNDDGTLKELI